MGIDVQLGCGHRIHLGDGSVTLGQVEHCIYCGEPSTVQYISTGMEGIVPIAQTDPGAAVSAWVERMTLRFGDKTYDQITRRDVTWIEALSLWRYGEKKEWLVAPIFTPKDIETAEVWEQHTWPTDGGWPHRFVPMGRKGDLRQCLASEHTFLLEKPSLDQEIRLVCTDPCPRHKLVALWVPNRVEFSADKDYDGEYIWNPCVDYPDRWESDPEFTEMFEISIPIKITKNIQVYHRDEGAQITYEVDPIFDVDAEVCPSCGREMEKPRVSLSRRGDYNVCPICGQMEAVQDFTANKLEI